MLWSTAGLFVRMAGLDTWTIVFWRSVFSAIALGLMFVGENRGRIASAMGRLRPVDLATVLLTIVSTISYVLALRLTTVANVMTVYAALPFIATGLAFIFLREKVTRKFVVAGFVALGGIAFTAGAGASTNDLWGILAALVMTTGFASQLVNVKRREPASMTLLLAMSAMVCIPLVAPWASHAIPSPSQMLACALYGVLTTGLAYVLALRGGRLISSGEAGLISMVDVALGPLWVWVFFAEVPATAALVGGAAVIAAVSWYLITSQVRPELSANTL